MQKQVSARVGLTLTVEDVAIASLRFKSGALGLIQGTTAAYPGLPREIEIYGEKGSVIYTDDAITHWAAVKDTTSISSGVPVKLHAAMALCMTNR